MNKFSESGARPGAARGPFRIANARNSNQNELLIEIMIAVLFFALCAAVLLQTFTAAKQLSHRAGIETRALIEMQDLAECLYAAQDDEALLAERGFSSENNIWRCDFGEYSIEIALSAQQTPAGELSQALITAYWDGMPIAQLPSVRYVPGEAAA